MITNEIFLEHADHLNQLLVKEKEFLSFCQVFSIEKNLEPAGYVATYCSYRDDRGIP